MSDFSFTIESKHLSRGLRPSKRMPRNSRFLVENAGAVGRDGVLQTIDELVRINTDVYVLAFDAQTGSFTIGNTVTGVTSGATGVVVTVTQAGGVGSLYLQTVSGTFQDDEIIYESAVSNIYTSDFTAGEDGWTGTRTTVTGNQDSITDGTTSKDDCIKGYASIDNDTHISLKGSLAAFADKHVRLTFSSYIPSGETHVDGFYVQQNGDASTTIHTTAAHTNLWTDSIAFFTGTANADQLDFFQTDGSESSFIGAASADDDRLYLKSIVLDEITNAALVNGTASIEESFPFPQIFVFTKAIIVCGETKIYEWVNDALILKLTVTAGSKWNAVDFHEYVYLSNSKVAVERNALSKVYEISSLPTCMAACNFNGQVIIGAPGVDGS